MGETNKHIKLLAERHGTISETASVSKACAILDLLERKRGPLRLTDIALSTGMNKATCLRIVRTLLAHGIVDKTPKNEYITLLRRGRGPIYRIGYAAQTEEFAFSRAVTEGVEFSAAKAGVELIALNNAYSPTIALQNTETFLRRDVQLVIEFQTDASIAALISTKLQEKHIPMIAIEIPHPNAVYFGANNTQAGLTAGRHLGRWAVDNWKGQIDSLLLLDLPMAGSLPGSRLTGTLLGLREVIPEVDDEKVKRLDGNGQFERSREAVRGFLQSMSVRRVLVSAINDPSALGALQAFRDCRREEHCAVIGQNGSSEAIVEMRRRSSRLIGSVGYFPEKYGEQVIKLATEMIEGKSVPPAVFIKHHLITPGNVEMYYPQPLRKQKTT
jgi:ribose transport system substrate-binding protein